MQENAIYYILASTELLAILKAACHYYFVSGDKSQPLAMCALFIDCERMLELTCFKV